MELEREYFTQLYNECGGTDWTVKENWLTEKPIGDWDGIFADSVSGSVYRIDFTGFGIRGEMPKLNGRLPNLEDVVVKQNYITKLPDDLDNIWFLNATSNLLTSVPIMPNIQFAKLSDNDITSLFHEWVGCTVLVVDENVTLTEDLVEVCDETKHNQKFGKLVKALSTTYGHRFHPRRCNTLAIERLAELIMYCLENGDKDISDLATGIWNVPEACQITSNFLNKR